MSLQKSKKAIVYETLKKRIISHSLHPGEPLNESVLSKELKISKTPVREAFQQLEKERVYRKRSRKRGVCLEDLYPGYPWAL